MSGLEGRSKPILEPLFDGRQEVARLASADRMTVARWAAKTAYMLNSASNYRETVPIDHYRTVRGSETVLPAKVAVFAQQHHDTTPFNWCQGATWQARGLDLQGFGALADASYKIALQFAKLILLVAFWPHAGWRLGLWRGIHVPLWPQQGPVAYYDDAGIEFPWFDSQRALGAFHASLIVVQVASS